MSEQNQSVIISQFCIMHYNDPNTNTYNGYISYPTRIKTIDGFETKCTQPPSEYGQWQLYQKFYALSPMIRPIPTGLKLINANTMDYYPYSTKNIKHVYDPFDIQQESISFMTWTQPVPGTVPLYLHISPNGDSYPSFDKNPPSEGNWTQNKMSPLFVSIK